MKAQNPGKIYMQARPLFKFKATPAPGGKPASTDPTNTVITIITTPDTNISLKS